MHNMAWNWGRPRRRYKRKYQFIDKKGQLRFAVTVAFFSLCFPLFLICLIASPSISLLLMGEEAADVQPILWEILEFFMYHWWVVLIGLIFIGLTSILFSHQIFGPIRRFENAVVQKKFNPSERVYCSLRWGDYFRDFSVLLEEVLNKCQMPEVPPEKEDTDV